MRASKKTKEQAALLLCIAAAESVGRYRGVNATGAEYGFSYDAIAVAFIAWCEDDQRGGYNAARLRTADKLFAEAYGRRARV
jgi:hypothetical protein